MRFRRWPLLALTALLGIGLAPAGLLTDALSGLCAGQCRFAEVKGYWWRGSADIYLQTGRSDRAWSGLGQLRWQPEWLGLRLTAGSGSARLAANWSGLRVNIDNLRLPAGSLLAHLGHGLPQAGWGGDLIAKASQLTLPWNFRAATGHGEIRWTQARSSLLEDYPLGDYRLAWTLPADGRWQGRLSSDQGPMFIDGELGLKPFRFVGQARLAPEASPLKKYVRLIGQPDGDNRYRISLPSTSGGS